jgi:hypothetical protein
MDRVKAWLNHGSGKYRPPRSWHLITWGHVALCAVLVAVFTWTTAVLPVSAGSNALTVVCASVLGLSAGFTVATAVNHHRWLQVKELTDKLEADLRSVGLLNDQPASRRYRKAINEN